MTPKEWKKHKPSVEELCYVTFLYYNKETKKMEKSKEYTIYKGKNGEVYQFQVMASQDLVLSLTLQHILHIYKPG